MTILLVFIVTAFFTYRYLGYAYKSNMADLWYYLSYIRKIVISNFADPSNPFIKGEGIEFVYGYNIWFLLLAGISRISKIDPFNVWGIMACFLSVVYLSAFYFITKSLFNKKIAFISTFIFFAYQAIFDGLHHFIHSPRPATINIFVLLLLALGFVVRYIKNGNKYFLLAASLLNFAMAFLHFVEPISSVMVLFLFLLALPLFMRQNRYFSVMIKSTVIACGFLSIAFLFAFAVKYNLNTPEPGHFIGSAKTLGISAPVFVWRNLFMINPGNFLGNIVVIMTLPILLAVSTKMRKDAFLLFVISSIVGMFIIQFNPVLATALGSVLTHIFITKGLTVNFILCFILWGYFISEFLLKYKLKYKPVIRKKDLLVWGLFFFIIMLPAALYFISNTIDLTDLAKQHLNISERHELKVLLKGYISLATFLLFTGLLISEIAFFTISRNLKNLIEERKKDLSKKQATNIALALLIVIAVISYMFSEKTMTRNGRPYPKVYKNVASGAMKHLNRYKDTLTIFMRNQGDMANIDKNTLLVDTCRIHALTPHKGISMYNPGFKKTACELDYEKRYRDVSFMQSGKANPEEFEKMISHYDTDLVYLNKNDPRNRSIISSLRGRQFFRLEFEDEDAIIFRYEK